MPHKDHPAAAITGSPYAFVVDERGDALRENMTKALADVTAPTEKLAGGAKSDVEEGTAALALAVMLASDEPNETTSPGERPCAVAVAV